MARPRTACATPSPGTPPRSAVPTTSSRPSRSSPASPPRPPTSAPTPGAGLEPATGRNATLLDWHPMEHWELVARERVRDTVAAYNHCGDRFLLDELVACFTVDGVLESKGDWVARGRDEIRRTLSGVRATEPVPASAGPPDGPRAAPAAGRRPA